MTYVAKVSLPGFDVATATPEQCAVHSDYPPLKAKTGQNKPHIGTLVVDFTATITQSVVNTIYTVDHNYGYIPLNFSSIVFNDGTQTIVGVGYAGVGTTLEIHAYCTSTQFIVTVFDSLVWTSNAASLQVSYYIFAESGT